MEIDITKYWNKIVSDGSTMYLSDLNTDSLNDPNDPISYILADCVRNNEKSQPAVSQLINALPGTVQVIFENGEKFPKNPLLNTLNTIISKPFVSMNGVYPNPGLGLDLSLQQYIRGLTINDKIHLNTLTKQVGIYVNTDTGEFSCDHVQLLSLLQSVEDHKQYQIVVQLQSESNKWDDKNLLEIFNKRSQEAEQSMNLESIDSLNSVKIFQITNLLVSGENVIYEFEASAGVFDTVGLGVVGNYSAVQLQHGLMVDHNPFSEDDKLYDLYCKLHHDMSEQSNWDMKKAIVNIFTPPYVIEFEVDKNCRKCHWKERHTSTYTKFMSMIDRPELSPSCMKLMKEEEQND